MMKITYLMSVALDDALGRYNLEHPSVEKRYHGIGGAKKPMEFGVNWCAMGTKTPEEAIAFAEDMKSSSVIAQALNELEIVLDWDTYVEGDDVTDEMYEAYEEAKWEFKRVLKKISTNKHFGSVDAKFWIGKTIEAM